MTATRCSRSGRSARTRGSATRSRPSPRWTRARLLVAGDPLEPARRVPGRRRRPGEWRLGYLGEAELDRALGDATLAVFPYRAELDQSGALLRAIGAGVPAVVYDVGGLAEPVRRLRSGPGGARPVTSTRWQRRSGAARRRGRARGRACRRPAGARRAHLGPSRRPRTCELYRRAPSGTSEPCSAEGAHCGPRRESAMLAG